MRGVFFSIHQPHKGGGTRAKSGRDPSDGMEGGRRTDRIVLEHAERAVGARAHEGAVVARHGHRDEADGDGAGFGWRGRDAG
jgi:hypothetical protein